MYPFIIHLVRGLFGRNKKWYNRIWKNERRKKISNKRWAALKGCAIAALDIYQAAYDLNYISQSSFVGYVMEFIEEKVGPLNGYEFYQVLAFIHKDIHQQQIIRLFQEGEIYSDVIEFQSLIESKQKELDDIKEQCRDENGNWNFHQVQKS